MKKEKEEREKEIINLLKIELKHLGYHLGETQIQMFENQSQGRGKYPNAKQNYLRYKTRIYQTERIIELIKTGWKPKKREKKERGFSR